MLNCEKQNEFPKRSTFNELGQQLSSIKHFGSADAILKYNSRGKQEPHFKCVCGFNFTECFSSNSPQRSVSRRQSNNHISWSWGGLIATCLMPKYQSHTQTHACLAHFPVAEWINLALCERVCLLRAALGLFIFLFFPYGEFAQNVNVSFSLHAGVSRRRSRRGVGYIYQVVFEHLKYTFPSGGLVLSSRSSRSHSQSSTQNMWLPTWHVVPRCATLWNCTSELTHKHRSVSVCANMSSLPVA